ncbi:MBL fold metallo-hydrolase [Streptomyces sp. NPDC093094]|uniref:MBL fold metallo-hydrolase n=1 Tax=Streptomyces sp. NPDC093094 TaxID=3366026 RepID=UPI0038135D96
MRVVLLGTAADGGIPRWDCVCARCAAARDGKVPARTQTAAAVTGNSRDWWLLDASPDLRAQLTAVPALWPGPAGRSAPVRGVLLTGAEPAQAAGLSVLRGAAGLTVHAAAPVLDALAPAREVLGRYAPWEWRDGPAEGGFVLSGGLVVTAYAVGARPPGYLPGRAADPRWATAYRVEDLATGGVLVYAPRADPARPGLDEALATADCALLDAALLAGGRTPAPSARTVAVRLGMTDPLLGTGSGSGGVEVLADGAELLL